MRHMRKIAQNADFSQKCIDILRRFGIIKGLASIHQPPLIGSFQPTYHPSG